MASSRTRTLGNIVAIRALEQRAGEMRLARTTAALEEKVRLEGEERLRQEDRERGWQGALSGRFDPGLASAWSDLVVRGQTQMSVTQRELADARGHRLTAAQSLQVAKAKAAAAEQIQRRAHRHDRRASETQAVQEVADAFARRGAHED